MKKLLQLKMINAMMTHAWGLRESGNRDLIQLWGLKKGILDMVVLECHIKLRM